MKVIFMRHGRLQNPYYNYDTLSFNELSRLAKGEIDPSIDEAWFEKNSTVFLSEVLDDNLPDTKLFCSPSNRAREAANLLARKLKIKNKNIIVADELKEVMFDPCQLISEEIYKKQGMEAVREAVFSSWVNGGSIESLDKCFGRIRNFEKKLKKTNSEVALCITHGFFMRLLYLYFKKEVRDANKINLLSLKNAPNFDYASGFIVLKRYPLRQAQCKHISPEYDRRTQCKLK